MDLAVSSQIRPTAPSSDLAHFQLLFLNHFHLSPFLGDEWKVHQAVIDNKETESGCTIHEVTKEVDGGPIVVQKVVKVESGETAESLKACRMLSKAA